MCGRRILIVCALFLTSCAGIHARPENLGELKTRLIAYKNAGYYNQDIAKEFAEAQRFLDGHTPNVKNPAIVLDIDETSLSNWPEMQANDFVNIKDGPCDHLPKGPCGHKAWQAMARDEAIAPALGLFHDARSKRVAVFFITGRDETLRAATEENLRRAGYHGWTKLIMRPARSKTPSAADYKAPQRETIESEGYTIIVNVGDQPSDLAGGHALRAFLVPNPFYRIP